MAFNWKRGAPKCVFITGGASGIGREFAHRLAAEGSSIAIFDLRPSAAVLDELRALARQPTQRFENYVANVTDAAGMIAVVKQAVSDFGPPELAVNSAGIQAAGVFGEQSHEEFDRVIAINLGGSRNFAAAILPHMKPGGHLVFLASLAALVGNYSYTAYCASKFAVRGFAEALRIEQRLRDIDISICCPAEVLTPMVTQEKSAMHPITKELKAFAGYQTVEVTCDQLLQGIARRRFEIVDSSKAKLTAFLSRHIPVTMRRIVDSMAAKVATKMGQS